MSEHNHNHPQHASEQHNGHVPVTVSATVGEEVNVPSFSLREFKFTFKKQKVTNEEGVEVKRPPVVLLVPIPTWEGLVDAMSSDAKVAAFVLDLCEEAIKDQVREQLGDNERPVNSQAELDTTKLSLSYIANLPKSERTGGGISKDTWVEWEKDYVEVMKELRGEEKAARAGKLFVGRFSQVKTDKQALKFLREQLQIWAERTTNAEDFVEVYSYLDNRANDLLTKDNVSQLANLM
jgi:hypothetical protein